MALLGLFSVQFTLGFLNQADEAKNIAILIAVAWVYIALTLVLIARDWKALLEHARFGLLNRS